MTPNKSAKRAEELYINMNRHVPDVIKIQMKGGSGENRVKEKISRNLLREFHTTQNDAVWNGWRERDKERKRGRKTLISGGASFSFSLIFFHPI